MHQNQKYRKMKSKSTQKLAELQRNPANIRNICILAHVDHGKTTLADVLVASNGIISHRMAGKLRYMDSREDEQVRGITMKSSAISLHFAQGEQEYLINLIDSPGHIDFSSEVSTAVRLCDGAIVIVDVVEGVCPQTHAVLRQAWLENLKPILVLNKIDRLVSEWKFTPLETYLHLQQILEQVNAITGELFTSGVFEKESSQAEENQEKEVKTNGDQVYEWSSALDDTDDADLYFSPDQGNVVFASALDGWAFSIGHFAELYSVKLGINAGVLKKTLWGDFYLDTKQKRIRKGAQAKGKKPLFVQFVLENLWSVYEAVTVRKDKEMIEKIVKSLNLNIPPRDSRHTDARVHLQAIVSQWLPLSKAVLDVVCSHLPSPKDFLPERVEKLMCGGARRYDSLPSQTQQLKEDFLSCSPGEDKPVIVFISKMFPFDRQCLPQNKQRPLTEADLAQRRLVARQRHAQRLAAQSDGTQEAAVSSEVAVQPEKQESEPFEKEAGENEIEEEKSDQVFLAFARVYSGTVKKGQKLYVLGPKHDPSRVLEEIGEGTSIDDSLTVSELTSGHHITSVTVNDLYMFMGRELEDLDEVPAGNVLGIGGLEEHVLKSGTLSSTVACPAFTAMYFEAAPIVKVALEPVHPADMPKLVHGMKLLNQADPCVEILIQETGEHVIMAAGEVHLQRCVDDIRERYSKIELNVSAPIVPFRETIVPPPTVDRVNEAITNEKQSMAIQENSDEEDIELIEPGLVETLTPNRMCTIRLRAIPLPYEVAKIIDDHAELIKTLEKYSMARLVEKEDTQAAERLKLETKDAIRDLKAKLSAVFQEAGKKWNGVVNRIVSFGPKRMGPNVLVNNIPEYDRPSIWSCLESIEDQVAKVGKIREYDSNIVSGFQLATLQGPMCEEPMMGVCFSVEKWEMHSEPQPLPSTLTEEDEENGELQPNQLKNNSTAKPKPDASLEPGTEKSVQFKRDVYGPVSGQIMSTVKDGLRKAFQSQPQRLMVAMYTCVIRATAEVLGKVYAVLGRRHGRVTFEDMMEGSQIFSITAVLPVVESFGFAEEIRKRTSGLASPQLQFSHWEVVDLDPYWVPTTEEEYMHFGEKADSENRARIYMDNVRRRKGLKVDERIVEFAEKQRTLSKKK
ncbi:elongation factor-like GTPase 1 isoform X1 [Lingula anatina]|uniref:Elongation factor-like 1 n=2 Tax=Lingula anatina TaxID=7574 RepID=A0A1S3JT90_LINAN|nr:elongation factor-like GTPase 1 isoform X1 [Lingula anatina]|eukprot:XP_013413557.1 elongation factor-like GTPase 1 isoform X1 [Lingula anatina]